MKKHKSLIVSDYDGTIKNIDKLNEFKENIKLIESLVNLQITFMISTGRVFESINKDIVDFNIPFNYLTCCNGNALFDEKRNIMWNTRINSLIEKELKAYYKYILSFEPKDVYGNFTQKNAVEYCIQLIENKQIRREIVNYLLVSNIFDYCTDGDNKFKIHIFNNSNKITSIEIVRKILKISKKEIYTIGDSTNDLEMIKKYNGFILGNNINNYNDLGIQKYDTFDTFVQDIQHCLVKKRI